MKSALTVPCLLLLASGCGSRAEPSPPRLVVLYSSCTVNKGFLSPYAPALRYTPALQALADESVVFRRHVSESGQSGIDFATLFSGTQADQHGVYLHPTRLDDRNQLVAECFAAAGYDTWFFSGHPMASVQLNYGQGVAPDHAFDHALPFLKNPGGSYRADFLDQLTANSAEFGAILARLSAEPDYRAFVQIAFTVSHEPYHVYLHHQQALAFLTRFPEAAGSVTPAELERWVPVYGAERHGLNWDFQETCTRLGLAPGEVERLAAVIEVLYAACIHGLDAYCGRVLESIRASGLDHESIFAFTTDHGELLRRENALVQWTHGLELAPEVLDTPWILRAPGLPPATYEGVTRSIDVMPTLLGLCGLRPPPACAGTDLAPVLRGRSPAPRQLAFSHTALWPEDRIAHFKEYPLLQSILPRVDPDVMSVRVRDGERVFKLRRLTDGSFQSEAYDHAVDPGETVNLFDPAQDEHRRMAEELANYKLRLNAGFDPTGKNDLSRDETLQYLRSLGYAR